MTPTRPALRYYGGKWRLAPWIISHFPEHDCYVEPFGGAMSVLLRKRPSYIEVYNDLDRDVVTFFRVLRERTDDLVNAIKFTPFSRAELADAYEPAQDDLECARHLYIRAVQAMGGPRTQWTSGWRFQKSALSWKRSIDDWGTFNHLYAVAARLREVYLECDDAISIIKRFDQSGTLFYCDPPYLADTRSKWMNKAYQCEMTDEQHSELAQVLRGIQGMAIISSYPSHVYEQLYDGWTKHMCRTRTRSINRSGNKQIATECLWISPMAIAGAVQSQLFE